MVLVERGGAAAAPVREPPRVCLKRPREVGSALGGVQPGLLSRGAGAAQGGNAGHPQFGGDRLPQQFGLIEAAFALAGAEHLRTLEHLDLSGNAITADGALALAKSPHLTNLRRLILSANKRLGERAVGALAERFGAGVTLN